MKKSILFLLIAILAVSCQKATFLKVDPTNIDVSKDGTTCSIALYSDADNFAIEESPDWVQTVIKDTILVCIVPANDTNATREGAIKVSCGGMIVNIPVVQRYVATRLELESDVLEFGSEGGEKSVNVKTDGSNITAEGLPEGAEYFYSNGSLTFKMPQNHGNSISSKVSLKADDITATINLIQKGEICSRCHGKGKITCPHCGGEGATYYEAPGAGCAYTKRCTYCGGNESTLEWGSGKITCPDCHGTGR